MPTGRSVYMITKGVGKMPAYAGQIGAGGSLEGRALRAGPAAVAESQAGGLPAVSVGHATAGAARRHEAADPVSV